jgi:hypothetical protein
MVAGHREWIAKQHIWDNDRKWREAESGCRPEGDSEPFPQTLGVLKGSQTEKKSRQVISQLCISGVFRQYRRRAALSTDRTPSPERCFCSTAKVETDMAKGSLPADIEQLLLLVGRKLEGGKKPGQELPELIAALSALPADTVSRAAPHIANSARLFRSTEEGSWLQRLLSRTPNDHLHA